MIFYEDTKELILYTLRGMIIKIHQKHFGHHLLQICCSTNESVKFDIIFFAKIVQYVKMTIVFSDKMVAVALYFISEEFKIISIHKKNIDDVRTKGTHEKSRQKNI